MEGIFDVIYKIKDDISYNIGNYLLGIGVISILLYIYLQFGGIPTILAFGITSILSSIVIELNKSKRKRNIDNRYR